MNTVLRNFLSVLRRFKMATALNVLGLSVAFAAFMIIMMQVDYERGFDRMHPESERIFRADLMEGDARMSIHARALVDAIVASSPRIERGALLNPFVGNVYVTVGEGERKQGFREPFVTCYPAITRIFGFSFTEGDADCLNDPDKLIIPQSMAQRMFGGAPAVGRAIVTNEYVWTKGEPGTFTVGGVYRDFPDNTQLDNVVYTAIDNTFLGEWDASNFICYLLLDGGASGEDVEGYINGSFDFSRAWNPNHVKLSISLTPLTGIYLSGDDGGFFKTGNANTIRILLSIALLIVLIAGINFTNFSIAMAPSRVKSINTQRVLGGSIAMLRTALVSEALVIAFVSWVAAVGIVGILDSFGMLSFMDAGMNPLENLPPVLLSGGIALATGLLAGLYPAWYVTSFQPAMALKGNFVLSSSGRKLRTALTGFQYVISIGLIVAAAFIQLQNKYIRTYDQGFDKDHIAIVEISQDMYWKGKYAYVNALKEHSAIEDVAFARQKIGSRDNYATYGLTYEDMTFYSYVIDVSYNFLRVMGIPIVEGRDFLPTDEQRQQGAGVSYVFNKVMQDELHLEAGSLIELGGNRSGRMVGVTGDLKFTSLRQSADDIAFIVNTDYALPYSFIRIKAGSSITEAVSHIRKTLAGIDPSYPFDIEFYDGIFNQLYKREESLNRSISMLSLLAILISIVGVFGLVVFESEYRRKEISLRKVFGSTTGQILVMFNRTYLRILGVCFLIAAPVAWYAVDLWLENFAYRTPMHWWVFAAALALVGVLTVATVTFQSRRAALANPSEAIKAE